MILDHVGITVQDYEKSKDFFIKALAPLGIVLVMETHGGAGMGRGGKPEFWFAGGAQPQRGLHLAFLAENRAQVRAFYAAALAAGGTDNGAPGPRPQYHPNY